MVLIVAAALGNRVFGQTGVPRPRIGRRWIGLVSALGAGVLVHGMLTGFDAIRRIATSTLAVRIWTDDDLSLGELGPHWWWRVFGENPSRELRGLPPEESAREG